MELKDFLEKQKNSTKKGKESENKLEGCLNAAFPNSLIVDKSGESKATDYMMKRDKSIEKVKTFTTRNAFIKCQEDVLYDDQYNNEIYTFF